MFERTPHVNAAALAETEQLLVTAREAREQMDGPRCIDALERALAVALERETGPRLTVISWRLSKAHFDFGAAAPTLECLAPLMERTDDPFADYPQGLRAVERIVRRYWDEVGYGSPLTMRVLEAARSTWENRSEPVLAARMTVQAAWQHACRGDATRLEQLLTSFDVLRPRDFRDGTHRHPDAPDAPSSVWWLQLDLARTVLRSATWTAHPHLAWRAFQSLEDAAEEAEVDRSSAFWFLEPAVHAGLDHAWRETDAYVAPYERALQHLEGPRAPYHRCLGEGVLAAHRGRNTTAATALEQAAHLARKGALGPEWELEALRRLAIVTHDPSVNERVCSLAECYAVSAFTSVKASGNAAR